MTAEADKLIAEAQRWVANATPEQLKEMWDRQRASYVRGMTTPCEHGVLDFEQCDDCRAAVEARLSV